MIGKYQRLQDSARDVERAIADAASQQHSSGTDNKSTQQKLSTQQQPGMLAGALADISRQSEC